MTKTAIVAHKHQHLKIEGTKKPPEHCMIFNTNNLKSRQNNKSIAQTMTKTPAVLHKQQQGKNLSLVQITTPTVEQ